MSVKAVVTEEERRGVAAAALKFLAEIEAGAISISVEGPTWDEVYDGHVRFLAGNGWRFTVYLDAGDWDYFDQVVSADGISLDFDWIAGNYGDLYDWHPSNDELWRGAPPNLQAGASD